MKFLNIFDNCFVKNGPKREIAIQIQTSTPTKQAFFSSFNNVLDM